MGAAATFIMIDALANKGGATTGIQQAIGKGPKAPATPQVSTPPVIDEPASQMAASRAAEQRRRQYANVGRSSTILTQGLGSYQLNDGSAPKVLLGL